MRIGRYEIERELGRGAMGVVYLARDPRVARKVAVKTYTIPAGLTADQEREFRERFLREAQAAGALSHPAIVTIHDADDDPDTRIPFIVMEYVDGRSLADVLAERGALGVEEAFHHAQTVAEALHAAHALGIVHRDVKPANLLIPSSNGTVKVTDFGVARMASSDLTRTGISLGSPAYMSPEQVKGEPADGRSDLFSLAVVLYEALCGARPFKGDNLTALAYAVAHRTPPPISQRRAGLPHGIDGFFDRALAKDPTDRFPDGLAFRDALRALRNGAHGDAGEAVVLFDPDGGPAEDAFLEPAEPEESILEVVEPGDRVLELVGPGGATLSADGDGEDAVRTAEAARASRAATLPSDETLPSPRSRSGAPRRRAGAGQRDGDPVHRSAPHQGSSTAPDAEGEHRPPLDDHPDVRPPRRRVDVGRRGRGTRRAATPPAGGRKAANGATDRQELREASDRGSAPAVEDGSEDRRQPRPPEEAARQEAEHDGAYRSPWGRGAEAGVRLLGATWAWLAEWRWTQPSHASPVVGGDGRSSRPRGSSATPGDSERAASPGARGRVDGRTRPALDGPLENGTAVPRGSEGARSSTRRGARAKNTPEVRAGKRGVALPVVAGVLAVAVVVAAARTVSPDRATLIVDGKNAYRDARLTIFADGKEVYSRSLAVRKKEVAIFGRTLLEYGGEEFEGRIRVDAGEVEITAEVLPEGETVPRRATLGVHLGAGETRALRVTTGKRVGSPVQLDLR